MNIDRRFFFIALAVVPSSAVWAAFSPKEIVEAVYAGDNSVNWDDRLAKAMGRKRPFSQAFNAALRAAEAKSRKTQEPWLDFDPISNSQDPSIHGLVISATSESGDKTTIRAEFRHAPGRSGRTTRVFYDFTRENGVWLLDNIRGGVVGEKDSNWSLHKMAAEAGRG